MKLTISKFFLTTLIVNFSFTIFAQNFQGKAVYMSKSKMNLGSWGAKLSEGQKKKIQARLKNRLEKTYVLTFNTTESMFLEEEQIDAVSGATDSWGAYFSRGDQYKNIQKGNIVQAQEFYGKKFLVKDNLYKLDWTLGTETKKIGDYTCYKAKAFVPKKEIEWYNFSWSDLRKQQKEEGETEEALWIVEAWYTPQIPVAHGPAEYWGLPGLILEVSADNTTLLCSEITINSKKEIVIEAPDKGKEITKKEYTATIQKKMVEMRNNRMGSRRSR